MVIFSGAVHNRCLHWIEHKKVIERHAHEMGIRQPESPEIPTDILNHKELQSRSGRHTRKITGKMRKDFLHE